MKYEKFVFYGDSFTYGQDSGGDDLYDETKTYPNFFGSILGKEIVNKGLPGLSNLGMLYKMIEYTHECHRNHEKGILQKTLNIVNLSSWLRGTVTSVNEKESYYYPYSANMTLKNATPLKFGTFAPNFPDNKKTPHLNKSKHIYYEETEERIFWDQYMIMLAMKDLSDRHNMGLIFVDVLFQKHKLEVYSGFDFDTINVPFIDFENEKGKTSLISIAPSYLELSKSSHFYEDGYEWMANKVYKKMKKEVPEIF